MIRWLRLLVLATGIAAMMGLGVIVGLVLVANNAWVVVDIPPWLRGLFGQPQHDIWLPALIAGWLGTCVMLVAIVAWSLWYVWRRRQYEALIERLERELARLRNLPFTEPAPLEDLPEQPDAGAARLLAAAEADTDDELGPWARE